MTEEIEYFIPHPILRLNKDVIQDPTLMECFRLMFDWANALGLKGQKVYGLQFVAPDDNNPVRVCGSFWCQIPCTKEQRDAWEENRTLDILHCLNNTCRPDGNENKTQDEE